MPSPLPGLAQRISVGFGALGVGVGSVAVAPQKLAVRPVEGSARGFS